METEGISGCLTLNAQGGWHDGNKSHREQINCQDDVPGGVGPWDSPKTKGSWGQSLRSNARLLVLLLISSKKLSLMGGKRKVGRIESSTDIYTL